MRKIEQRIVVELSGKKESGSCVLSVRDKVLRLETGSCYFLHNENIFNLTKDGRVYFSLRGWNTATTRSRLNALLSVYHPAAVKIRCKNNTPFIVVNGVSSLMDTQEVYTFLPSGNLSNY